MIQYDTTQQLLSAAWDTFEPLRARQPPCNPRLAPTQAAPRPPPLLEPLSLTHARKTAWVLCSRRAGHPASSCPPVFHPHPPTHTLWCFAPCAQATPPPRSRCCLRRSCLAAAWHSCCSSPSPSTTPRQGGRCWRQVRCGRVADLGGHQKADKAKPPRLFVFVLICELCPRRSTANTCCRKAKA